MQNSAQNIIYIDFFDKSQCPNGKWKHEPDFCKWTSYGLTCIAIRDMKLGMWRSFVGVDKAHQVYSKSIPDLILCDYDVDFGHRILVGKLPHQIRSHNDQKWWIGFECSSGTDLLPFLINDTSNALYIKLRESQTYKDLIYVKRVTGQLAKRLSK